MLKIIVITFLSSLFITSSYGNVTTDDVSTEQVKILDKLETVEPVSLKDVKLDDGSSVSDTLLERDPCFLVKFPNSKDKELIEKAKDLCDKKSKK